MISIYFIVFIFLLKAYDLLFFSHEERVKHVVIETKPDPATGVLYYITPKGPCFDSLSALIEKAKASRIIQNHAFDVILTKSPPKVN